MQQQVRQQKLAMTQLDDAAAEETPAPATAYDDKKFGTAGNEVGHHPHPPLSAPTAGFPSFYTSSPLPFLAPRPLASRSLCLGATSLSVLCAWPNPHHQPPTAHVPSWRAAAQSIASGNSKRFCREARSILFHDILCLSFSLPVKTFWSRDQSIVSSLSEARPSPAHFLCCAFLLRTRFHTTG
jgi:hypothetical protein